MYGDAGATEHVQSGGQQDRKDDGRAHRARVRDALLRAHVKAVYASPGGSRPSCAKRRRSDGGLRHMPRIGSPTAAIARRHRLERERRRARRSATSSQPERGRHARVGRRPHRVRATRSCGRVRSGRSRRTRPTRSATRHVVVATAWSPTRRSTSSAIAFAKPAHLGEQQLGPDRREDVQPGRAGRLRVRAQPELVQHLAHDERDLAHVRPLAVARRVEVDQQVVGPLDLGHARVPRVQLDAAEVRRPRRARRRCRRSRTPSSARSGTDEISSTYVGMVRRHAFLVEEVRARRRSGSASCGTAGRRRWGRAQLGDADVVRDEVALRQPARREEDLVRVRDRDVVPTHAHPVYPRRNAESGPRTRFSSRSPRRP